MADTVWDGPVLFKCQAYAASGSVAAGGVTDDVPPPPPQPATTSNMATALSLKIIFS